MELWFKFQRKIGTTVYLKFDTSMHAQLSISRYYMLFKNFRHDMKLKLTLGIFFDKWNRPLILWTWSCVFSLKIMLVWKMYTVLLPNSLCPNVSFQIVWRLTFQVINYTLESISRKSHKKSYDCIHDVI